MADNSKLLKAVKRWTNLEMRQREMSIEDESAGDVLEDRKQTALLDVIKIAHPKRWYRHKRARWDRMSPEDRARLNVNWWKTESEKK